MGKILGIDFGNAYSRIGYIDEVGTFHAIDTVDGMQLRSAVYYDPSSNAVTVGEAAYYESLLDPYSYAMCMKRYLGDYEYTFTLGETELSPTALSSAVIQQLIRDAEMYFDGKDIDGVIAAYPAYFGAAAKHALQTAIQNARLFNGEPVRFLGACAEPVAAIIAYMAHEPCSEKKNIVVFDLGDTFDVTVAKAECDDGKVSVNILSCDGDHQFGGFTWDDALKSYVVSKFCEATGYYEDDLYADAEMTAWIREKIEKAKMSLSNRDSASLVMTYNECRERITVDRDTFEAITSHLMDKAVLHVNNALQHAGLGADDIDEILLVGGASRMPQVKKRLLCEYGKPVISYMPLTLVCAGVSLIGRNLR